MGVGGAWETAFDTSQPIITLQPQHVHQALLALNALSLFHVKIHYLSHLFFAGGLVNLAIFEGAWMSVRVSV